MCCLFGLLDYSGLISGKDKSKIISILSTECEIRGKDATGIAYNTNSRLCVYKRALPANRMYYSIPNSTHYIMGHTRLTTQGSEKFNYNNHPFYGSVQSGEFALCHNGILYNDIALRKSETLPLTKIQTDSYVAIQLIEKQNALNFGSLANMAEKVEGSFTFTVLDNYNNLYVIKGNNPFCLYHFQEQGFYIYASTEEILIKTITRLSIQEWKRENISLSCGDILKVDRRGKLQHSSFKIFDICFDWENKWYSYHNKQKAPLDVNEDSYLKELKSVAFYYGYSSDDIDNLMADGFSCEEIEELIYDPEMFYYYDDYKLKERELCRQM